MDKALINRESVETSHGFVDLLVPDVIEADFFCCFFLLSVDRFSLVKDGGLWCDNTELKGTNVNNLEFHILLASDNESVSLVDWSVVVLEVGDKICLRDVLSDSLNGVFEWQNMDLGGIWYVILWGMDSNNVSAEHSEVPHHSLVHQNASIISTGLFCGQSDAHGFLSLLTFEDDGVTLLDLELVHLQLSQLNN